MSTPRRTLTALLGLVMLTGATACNQEGTAAPGGQDPAAAAAAAGKSASIDEKDAKGSEANKLNDHKRDVESGSKGDDPAKASNWSGRRAAEHRVSTFTTPTGNIRCYLGTRFSRCDIGYRTYRTPSRPNVSGRWGNSLYNDGEYAGHVAVDDYINPGLQLVGYPHVVYAPSGNYKATVTEDGVWVTHRNGLRFFLSREDWDVAR